MYLLLKGYAVIYMECKYYSIVRLDTAVQEVGGDGKFFFFS